MKIRKHLRVPLTAGLSRYSLETGICLIDAIELASATEGHAVQTEFAHETAHWITEALTSIGQFLVTLKASRDERMVAGIVGDSEVQRLFRNRILQDDGVPLFPDWRDEHFSAVRSGQPSEHLFDYWIGNFRAETMIERHVSLPMDMVDRIATMAGAIEGYVTYLNGERLLDNPLFGHEQTDHFIYNSLRRHASLTLETEIDWVCETVDLIEAIAVCAELLSLERHGTLDKFAEPRFEALLADTTYLVPLKHILTAIGVPFGVAGVMLNMKVILVTLECALNPPIPPIENVDFSDFNFGHVYPPTRFVGLLKVLARPGALEKLSLDRVYDERVDWDFQLGLYQAVDPKGRTFEIHIAETNDFDVFGELPNRVLLENKFVWISNGRLLTPHSLRLWSASQLRLTAARAGLITLTQVLLADSLHTTGRFSEPVLTIRSRWPDGDDRTIPVNTTLLNASEGLEWYMVMTGFHYVIGNFLVEHGPLEFLAFLVGGDFDRARWVAELRRRTEAVFGSVLFA